MNKQANKAVVIFHANCMDGFASAWAFHILKEKDYAATEYYSCNYGEIPHTNLTASDVFILDFSFPRHVITTMALAANSVLILDHHKTAQEALTGWEDKPSSVEIVFDMKRSGAGITWDYFNKDNQGRVSLIDYVEDRDLWKFACYKSKEINALVAITDKTFEAYTDLDAFIGYTPEQAAHTGSYLLKQHQQICNEIVLNARKVIFYDLSLDGSFVEGLGCNCPHQFASEVGNLLAQQSGTFGYTYFSDSSGAIKGSLRSIGDFDVSKLAAIFGGGGHKNAAGFTLAPNETDRSDVIKLWTLGK